MAQRIKSLRTTEGWTQEEFAERAASSRYLADLEFGRRNPSVRTLVRVANAFGNAVQELFEADVKKREEPCDGRLEFLEIRGRITLGVNRPPIQAAAHRTIRVINEVASYISKELAVNPQRGFMNFFVMCQVADRAFGLRLFLGAAKRCYPPQ